MHQTGPPFCSTTNGPSHPLGRSTPRTFSGGEPPIVTENKGDGAWPDFWTICDRTHCCLFFSDGNGHRYRSRTMLAAFPNEFRAITVVLSEPDRFDLFEAGDVYRLGDAGGFLMLVEALATGSGRRRSFRAWRGRQLDTAGRHRSQPLRPLRQRHPASGQPAWPREFSRGEMIPDGAGRTRSADPCRLRFLYQGCGARSERRVPPAALAAGPAHPDEPHLLIR